MYGVNKMLVCAGTQHGHTPQCCVVVLRRVGMNAVFIWRVHVADLSIVTFLTAIWLTLFRPGGGGGLLRPYKTLKLNNFKTVEAMTTKFSDFF